MADSVVEMHPCLSELPLPGREARSCEEAIAFIVTAECKSFVLAGHTAQVPVLSVGLSPDPQLHELRKLNSTSSGTD